MKTNPDTSRRNFLKLTGLAASTGTLGGFGHAVSAQTQVQCDRFQGGDGF